MADKSTTQPKGLSKNLKTFFGIGDAGFSLMTNVESFYFMSFLTDYAGFSAVIATAINSIFSIIDACLSWVYGGILTGTKAKKWGRYRSWLILTPWLVPFLYAFQFVRIGNNEVVSAVIIVAAAVLSHVLWNIPFVANITLISIVPKTPEDKAAMASSRATWQGVGSLLFSYMGLPLATLLANFVGEKNQFAATAFCLAALMAVGYYAHFKMTEGYEEIEDANAPKAKANKVSVPDMFRSLFQNPQLMILMVADLAKYVVTFVTAAGAIYYFRDAMGNAGLMTAYTLSISIGTIVGAYSMRHLGKKLDARTSMIVAYSLMAVCLLGAYLCYANAVVVIALMTLTRAFLGLTNAAGPALYADTIVYATWKTGKNAAGWIMGLQNLPLKVAIFLRGTIIGACLAAVGWQSGVVLEGTARQAMTVGFALVPAVFCVVGLLLMAFGYKLTKEKVAQYQAEINAKQ